MAGAIINQRLVLFAGGSHGFRRFRNGHGHTLIVAVVKGIDRAGDFRLVVGFYLQPETSFLVSKIAKPLSTSIAKAWKRDQLDGFPGMLTWAGLPVRGWAEWRSIIEKYRSATVHFETIMTSAPLGPMERCPSDGGSPYWHRAIFQPGCNWYAAELVIGL